MADRPLPGWPRGLSAPLAAAYIGLSVSQLLVLESEGEFKATWLTKGRKVYLREQLDSFLDRKDGRGNAASDPADDVPDWQKALMADGQGDASVR